MLVGYQPPEEGFMPFPAPFPPFHIWPPFHIGPPFDCPFMPPNLNKHGERVSDRDPLKIIKYTMKYLL